MAVLALVISLVTIAVNVYSFRNIRETRKILREINDRRQDRNDELVNEVVPRG